MDYLTAEYCATVWCRSANIGVLYDTLLIVTGCLRPAPIDNPQIISSNQPAELRRLGATLSLTNSATLGPNIC